MRLDCELMWGGGWEVVKSEEKFLSFSPSMDVALSLSFT